MSRKLLELKQYVMKNDYINRENTHEYVYKDELYDKCLYRGYNYKTGQDEICQLVNKLNNRSKEYDLFVYWLKECGLIDEHILKTFEQILNTTNPIITMIEKSNYNGASSTDAISIYNVLKDAGFLGD